MNTPPKDAVNSVLRALSVLDAISKSPAPMRARDVANEVGLAVPTAYHLLNTLVHAGYVDKDGPNFGLTPKLAELSLATTRQLLRPPEWMVQEMHLLVSELNETAYISRWHQGDVVVAAVAEGSTAVRVTGVYPGLRGHAYARASGKVLLAFGTRYRLEDYFAATELQPLTPNTVSTRDALVRQLETVRRNGYAVDREEFLEGVCCVSAPLSKQPSSIEFAITVTIPASRFEELEEQAAAALLAAAGRVQGKVYGS